MCGLFLSFFCAGVMLNTRSVFSFSFHYMFCSAFNLMSCATVWHMFCESVN